VSPPKKIISFGKTAGLLQKAVGSFSATNVIARRLAVNADFALFFTGIKDVKYF
jgi:hypothetical protein